MQMSKKLVIVESPAKAKTIGRFLGSGVKVQASMGHVRDLPSRALGVDISNNFKPDYELTLKGKRVVKELKPAAAAVDDIYLATDPDREGEAIAWHLREVLKPSTHAAFHRITFHEVTQSAIQKSFAAPGDIEMDLVAAQQARRVLDRLVGYQVSPLLWRYIQKGTSAGRVQSVALRLIVEREREINAFQAEEYWNLDGQFTPMGSTTSFRARLSKVNGRKANVANETDANRLGDALQAAGVSHVISKVASTPRRKHPAPPFITSTLQQAAGSALKLSATQTMRIAQELYEGVELGSSGPVGLITYMRTDSVNIAREAQEQARAFIAKTYGNDYVPQKPNIYRSKKSAQEAHEAIRPTDVNRTPDSLASSLTPPQLKVYRIIWNRFVASQMSEAQQMEHVVEVESTGGPLAALEPTPFIAKDEKGATASGTVCTFHTAARETLFPGYMVVYNIREVGEEEDAADTATRLPDLHQGAACALSQLLKEQCFTTPPSRYSEASLVKALEQNGVGRPSTYATTVNTIQERDYVKKEKGILSPTPLGISVNDFLVQQMPELFDIGFTAQMEEELDQVEEGKIVWEDMIRDFYDKFQKWLGSRAPVQTPSSSQAISRILGLFPAGFPFAPPVKRGNRTYDDAKFRDSIEEQLGSGKALTERQWNALVAMVARYADQHPEMMDVAKELGLEEQIHQFKEMVAKAAETVPVEIPPAVKKLFDAMKGVKWHEPVKRGNRIYDDGKFYRSLAKQVEGGKGLSAAQIQALGKIASKYAGMIKNYDQLAAELGSAAETAGAVPPVESSPLQKDKLEQLLAMAGEIKEWQTSSGRSRYNDEEFLGSLHRQLEQKGVLSEKQIAALLKVLGKYASQIERYEERMKAIAPTAAAAAPAAPKELDEVCPECGAKLVLRHSRRGPFVGCSAYPKCHYIAKK